VRWAAVERAGREIERISPRDAARYGELCRELATMSAFVMPLLLAPVPDPCALGPRGLAALAAVARRALALGPHGIHRLVKLGTMSVADYLDDWLDGELLVASLAATVAASTRPGVRGAGTALGLLPRLLGERDAIWGSSGLCRGGAGRLSLALAAAARALGAEIRTEATVSKIVVRGGVATGVVLADGSEIAAHAVVSAVDPGLTLRGLLGEGQLPDPLGAELGRLRPALGTAKVNLALDAPPVFTSRPEARLELCGDIIVAPSFDYLERAREDAAAGRLARRPVLEVVIPSLTDPSLVPAGKHLLGCLVHDVPSSLAGAPESAAAEREALGDAVVETLAELAPGLGDRILYRQVLTPSDRAQARGAGAGDHLLVEPTAGWPPWPRAVPGWARYRTPVRRLWLCGRGTHPGDALPAASGKLAAERMLQERAR
jgi:phytoene dehydrogenase-like protein